MAWVFPNPGRPGSHDDPLGRVSEAKSVQKANGGPVDMAVRLNNAGKQGPSFQVKHPAVRSCHRSDLGIAPQLHDSVTLDGDGLVDTSHLGRGDLSSMLTTLPLTKIVSA